MWFWLREPPPVTPGLNLSVTVVPGTAGTSLQGRVLDTSGAAVVNVVATVTGANISRTATTNAQGQFNFPNLPRGTYRVSVQSGALTAEQTVTIT
jgi:hypothetical protein